MTIVVFSTSNSAASATSFAPLGMESRYSNTGKSAVENWLMACIEVFGDDVFTVICTNALHYKYWERWNASLPKAAVAIVNTGRTTGDCAITGDDVARALDYVIRAGVVSDVTMNVVVVPVDFPLQTVEIGVETLRIALMTGPVEDKLVIPLRNSDCDACGNVLVWPALSDGVLASIASSTLCVDIGRCCVSTGPSGVPSTAIHTKAHARVGIMGNPSDGFFGKTVAATIEGFWAEAWAWPSPDPKIHFIPNHLYDPMTFANLKELSAISRKEGYVGGVRLMQATCHRLFVHVQRFPQYASRLSTSFCLTYHTNIPRQVGLAGSSAIIVALLRALIQVLDLTDVLDEIELSPPKFAAFVLAIETEELGIAAGLQDRVAQTYGGCTFMDFSEHWFHLRGYGEYVAVDPSCLPPLFLAYCPDPKDSGKVHSPVKQRWLDKDPAVIAGMQKLGGLAQEFHDVITTSARTPSHEVASKTAALMSANFATRIELYGEAVVGERNRAMVGIAKRLGTSAKLPGSGGAVVGVCDVIGMIAAGSLPEVSVESVTSSPANWHVAVDAGMACLRREYERAGYVFTPISVHSP